ncbi:microtubule-associated protein futsch-like [Gigantopelta aegis]|uniref:microtubule-associated protein futsch-like n=1 Tax=Gigantopelta aegis TaxID=1735272 RepID=UPI001B88CFD2|nr:microtubule-associated protein futsch-like [Gigantopelta aegis]
MFELTTAAKLTLVLAIPTTFVLLYWLFRQDEDDDNYNSNNRVTTSRQTIITVKVPKRCVGTVIGRQGSNIKKIQEKSGARVHFQEENVLSPQEAEERTVTIRGSSDSAQEAELMIRQIIADMADPFTEQITVPGYTLGRIIVSAIEHPGHFWVQILSEKAEQLEKLTDSLTAFYRTQEATENFPMPAAAVGDVVAAPFEQDDEWYRARVTDVGDEKVDLFYVDYGDSCWISRNMLRQIRPDFLSLPFQAVECKLSNIKPKGEEWSDEAIEVFEDLTHCAQWKVLISKTVHYETKGEDMVPCLRLYDTNGPEDVDISLELIKRGFAEEVLEGGQMKSSASPERDIDKDVEEDAFLRPPSPEEPQVTVPPADEAWTYQYPCAWAFNEDDAMYGPNQYYDQWHTERPSFNPQKSPQGETTLMEGETTLVGADESSFHVLHETGDISAQVVKSDTSSDTDNASQMLQFREEEDTGETKEDFEFNITQCILDNEAFREKSETVDYSEIEILDNRDVTSQTQTQDLLKIIDNEENVTQRLSAEKSDIMNTSLLSDLDVSDDTGLNMSVSEVSDAELTEHDVAQCMSISDMTSSQSSASTLSGGDATDILSDSIYDNLEDMVLPEAPLVLQDRSTPINIAGEFRNIIGEIKNLTKDISHGTDPDSGLDRTMDDSAWEVIDESSSLEDHSQVHSPLEEHSRSHSPFEEYSESQIPLQEYGERHSPLEECSRSISGSDSFEEMERLVCEIEDSEDTPHQDLPSGMVDGSRHADDDGLCEITYEETYYEKHVHFKDVSGGNVLPEKVLSSEQETSSREVDTFHADQSLSHFSSMGDGTSDTYPSDSGVYSDTFSHEYPSENSTGRFVDETKVLSHTEGPSSFPQPFPDLDTEAVYSDMSMTGQPTIIVSEYTTPDTTPQEETKLLLFDAYSACVLEERVDSQKEDEESIYRSVDSENLDYYSTVKDADAGSSDGSPVTGYDQLAGVTSSYDINANQSESVTSETKDVFQSTYDTVIQTDTKTQSTEDDLEQSNILIQTTDDLSEKSSVETFENIPAADYESSYQAEEDTRLPLDTEDTGENVYSRDESVLSAAMIAQSEPKDYPVIFKDTDLSVGSAVDDIDSTVNDSKQMLNERMVQETDLSPDENMVSSAVTFHDTDMLVESAADKVDSTVTDSQQTDLPLDQSIASSVSDHENLEELSEDFTTDSRFIMGAVSPPSSDHEALLTPAEHFDLISNGESVIHLENYDEYGMKEKQFMVGFDSFSSEASEGTLLSPAEEVSDVFEVPSVLTAGDQFTEDEELLNQLDTETEQGPDLKCVSDEPAEGMVSQSYVQIDTFSEIVDEFEDVSGDSITTESDTSSSMVTVVDAKLAEQNGSECGSMDDVESVKRDSTSSFPQDYVPVSENVSTSEVASHRELLTSAVPKRETEESFSDVVTHKDEGRVQETFESDQSLCESTTPDSILESIDMAPVQGDFYSLGLSSHVLSDEESAPDTFCIEENDKLVTTDHDSNISVFYECAPETFPTKQTMDDSQEQIATSPTEESAPMTFTTERTLSASKIEAAGDDDISEGVSQGQITVGTEFNDILPVEEEESPGTESSELVSEGGQFSDAVSLTGSNGVTDVTPSHIVPYTEHPSLDNLEENVLVNVDDGGEIEAIENAASKIRAGQLITEDTKLQKSVIRHSAMTFVNTESVSLMEYQNVELLKLGVLGMQQAAEMWTPEVVQSEAIMRYLPAQTFIATVELAPWKKRMDQLQADEKEVAEETSEHPQSGDFAKIENGEDIRYALAAEMFQRMVRFDDSPPSISAQRYSSSAVSIHVSTVITCPVIFAVESRQDEKNAEESGLQETREEDISMQVEDDEQKIKIVAETGEKIFNRGSQLDEFEESTHVVGEDKNVSQQSYQTDIISREMSVSVRQDIALFERQEEAFVTKLQEEDLKTEGYTGQDIFNVEDNVHVGKHISESESETKDICDLDLRKESIMSETQERISVIEQTGYYIEIPSDSIQPVAENIQEIVQDESEAQEVLYERDEDTSVVEVQDIVTSELQQETQGIGDAQQIHSSTKETFEYELKGQEVAMLSEPQVEYTSETHDETSITEADIEEAISAMKGRMEEIGETETEEIAVAETAEQIAVTETAETICMTDTTEHISVTETLEEINVTETEKSTLTETEDIALSERVEEIAVTETTEKTDVAETQKERYMSKTPDEIFSDEQDVIEISEGQEAMSVTKTQEGIAISETRQDITISETQEDFDISETQEDIAISETQEDIAISETQEDFDITETQEDIAISETQEDIAISETQEDIFISETQEDIAISETQEDIAISETQEDIVISETQEDIAISETQEDIAISEKQQDLAISETQQDIAIFETQEDIAISETQEDIAVSETQEDIAISETQEEIAITEADIEAAISEMEDGVLPKDTLQYELGSEEDTTISVTKEDIPISEIQEAKEVSETTEDIALTETPEGTQEERYMSETPDEIAVCEEQEVTVLSEEQEVTAISQKQEDIVISETQEEIMCETQEEIAISETLEDITISETSEESGMYEQREETAATETPEETQETLKEKAVSQEQDTIIISETQEDIAISETPQEIAVTEQLEEMSVTETKEEIAVTEMPEEIVFSETQEEIAVSETPEEIALKNKKKLLSLKCQEDIAISETQEEIAISETQEEVAISENKKKFQSLKHKKKLLYAILISETQEDIAISETQEEVAISETQEEIAISETQEDIAISETQEEIAISETQEDIAISETQEDIAISETQEEVAISEEQEDIAISETPEEIAVSEEPEAIAISETQEEIAISEEPEDIAISETPEEIAVSEEPEVIAISETQEEIAVSEEPEAIAISDTPDEIPVSEEPEVIAISEEQEEIAVSAEPEAIAISETPEEIAVSEEPEAIAISDTPDEIAKQEEIAVSEEPEAIAISETPEEIAVSEEPEAIAISDTPDEIPVSEEPEVIAISEEQEEIAVSAEPEAIAISETPEEIAVSEEPEAIAISDTPDEIAVSEEPEVIAISVEQEEIAVSAEPEAIAISKTPEEIAVSEEPEAIAISDTPDEIAVSEEPEVIAISEEQEEIAVSAEPEAIAISETPEEIAVSEEPEAIAISETPEEIAVSEEPEAIAISETPEEIAISENQRPLRSQKHQKK